MLTAGSIVLATLNLTVMALLARKIAAGWLIGLGEMVIGVPYDIWSRQYGFVAVTVVTVPVYVKGGRNFRRNRGAAGEAGQDAA